MPVLPDYFFITTNSINKRAEKSRKEQKKEQGQTFKYHFEGTQKASNKYTSISSGLKFEDKDLKYLLGTFPIP